MKKTHNKRIFGIIFVLVIVALIIGGIITIVALQNKQKEVVTVRYAAPLTIAAAPLYVADTKGFWADAGINVKVSYFSSGKDALNALLANDAEVMSVSETPPLRAYLSGAKISIIGTMTEHQEAKLSVRTDRISKPSDLKGKKIGTVTGTNSDYYMYRWLEANNIKTSDVQIVPLSAGALAQAFVQGDIDAMFAWEPYNYNAVSKIPNLATSWPTTIYHGRTTIVMNDSYLNAHTQTAEQVLKGIQKAETYIMNNPADAKKIVMARTQMTSGALDALWGEYVYKLELDNGLTNILNDEASWIAASQTGLSTTSTKQLINPIPLLNVNKMSVGGNY